MITWFQNVVGLIRLFFAYVVQRKDLASAVGKLDDIKINAPCDYRTSFDTVPCGHMELMHGRGNVMRHSSHAYVRPPWLTAILKEN